MGDGRWSLDGARRSKCEQGVAVDGKDDECMGRRWE